MNTAHTEDLATGAAMARETGQEYLGKGDSKSAKECFDRADWYDRQREALEADDGPEIANDIALIEVIIQRAKNSNDLADYATDIATLIDQLQDLYSIAMQEEAA